MNNDSGVIDKVPLSCIATLLFSDAIAQPASARCSSRVWVLPNKRFATQNKQMYIRLHCLRALWSLSTRLPNLKIILQSEPSVFKFNLKRAVIFLHKNFRVCNRSKQGELVPPRNFWIRFFKSNFKNACWASPKPDIQHKIALATRFRWYRISKFSWRKIRSMKIGVDSFNIASNRNYYFRFWRQKAEVSLPKKSSNFMVCSIQSRSQEPDLPSPVFSLKTGPVRS